MRSKDDKEYAFHNCVHHYTFHTSVSLKGFVKKDDYLSHKTKFSFFILLMAADRKTSKKFN